MKEEGGEGDGQAGAEHIFSSKNIYYTRAVFETEWAKKSATRNDDLSQLVDR